MNLSWIVAQIKNNVQILSYILRTVCELMKMCESYGKYKQWCIFQSMSEIIQAVPVSPIMWTLISDKSYELW